MTTWTPTTGEAVLYVKPASSHTTWNPYGSGTRASRRPVRVTRPEQRLLATVLEVNDDSILVHVEGGGRVLTSPENVHPYA